MSVTGSQSDWRELFHEALPAIEESIRFVCRRRRCRHDEGEDFASAVRLRFMENDCALLRQFVGRSRLQTYVNVVVLRLFIDYRRRHWGVWRPSARARKLGPVAVRLDTLLYRDGYDLDAAIQMLRTNEGVPVSENGLRDLAAQLEAHPVRREEGSATLEAVDRDSGERADGALIDDERRRRARDLRHALKGAFGQLGPEDVLLLRMRFQDRLTMPQIAKVLATDPKVLYRRTERLLDDLRAELERRGFRPEDVDPALESATFDEEPILVAENDASDRLDRRDEARLKVSR